MPGTRPAGPLGITVADYCLAAMTGLAVLLVFNVHFLLTQPYWLDEAWVADSVRAPLGQAARLASSTPLGWTLLLRLVPGHGLERQRLVPLAFAGLAVATGYLLGRELRLTRFAAGLLTGAAVLLSPAILATGDLKQYTAEALSAVLLWLLVARVENAWRQGSTPRWRLAALALTASLGCVLAETAVVTGAAALGCLGLECLIRRQWRRLAEVAVAAVAALAVFGVVYEVLIKPKVNGSLAYYWRPKYLPGNEKSAWAFLDLQLHDLAPYLAFAGRGGNRTIVVTLALAAAGVVALALLGRPALAAMLPVTVVTVIVASAARVYPFGDERTSTFWLVMVPVLIAIAAAAGIHWAASHLTGWTGPAAALTATAAVAACLTAANMRWIGDRAFAVNPQNPYAQITYVEAHFRPGDVILVNLEASYAFAYYYHTPAGDYQPSTSAANGFVPQYPGIPWIIALTGRGQWAITNAVARADAIIAAEPASHRGRVWIIADHVAWEEALFWKEALADGRLTTVTFRPFNGLPQEPLRVYQPAPPSSWSVTGAQRGKTLSLTQGFTS